MMDNIRRIARRIIGAADSHFIGEMFFPGLLSDPRYENRAGTIVIGGDRADIWASSAHADSRDDKVGVTLTDVELRTTMDLSKASPDEIREEAEEVVQTSYASIQEDTFMPTNQGPGTRRGSARASAGCDQCEALSINGVATHETGCPIASAGGLVALTSAPRTLGSVGLASRGVHVAVPFCDEDCAESYNS